MAKKIKVNQLIWKGNKDILTVVCLGYVWLIASMFVSFQISLICTLIALPLLGLSVILLIDARIHTREFCKAWGYEYKF